jgi:hypothetical protein
MKHRLIRFYRLRCARSGLVHSSYGPGSTVLGALLILQSLEGRSWIYAVVGAGLFLLPGCYLTWRWFLAAWSDRARQRDIRAAHTAFERHFTRSELRDSPFTRVQRTLHVGPAIMVLSACGSDGHEIYLFNDREIAAVRFDSSRTGVVLVQRIILGYRQASCAYEVVQVDLTGTKDINEGFTWKPVQPKPGLRKLRAAARRSLSPAMCLTAEELQSLHAIVAA